MKRIDRDVLVLSIALWFGLMAGVTSAQAVAGPSLAEAQKALAAT